MDAVRCWNAWISATTNRKILGATIVIALFSIVSRVASTAKEIVVASVFGAGDTVDSFLMALVVPMYAINVISGSFNAALIPTYIRVREQEGPDSAQKLLSNSLAGSCALLVCATIIMLAAAPYYLPLIASGFSAGKISLTARLLYILSPLIILYGLNSMWGAVLNADRQFGLVAATPVITPLIVMLFLMFAGPTWGIYSMAIGTVCGICLELTVLGIVLIRKGISLRPRWYGLDANVHQVIKQLVPMISGALLMSGTGFIDQSMSAMLGSGSISALSYGSKIVSVFLALSATALGTALIPFFSTMVARREWGGIRHTVRRYYLLIIITSVPATAAFIFLSEPLVRVLYQRGAFTAENTQLVSQVQSLLALQIPFYLAAIVMVRLLSSMMANHILMIGNIINVVACVTLNYLFMQKMGVGGIALSTSCVYLISFIFLYCSWQRISKNAGNAVTDACPVQNGARHD
jgi:putative peptidoglycan lipid II flippase